MGQSWVATTVGRSRPGAAKLSAESLAWSVTVPVIQAGRIPLRKAIANRQAQLAELGFAFQGVAGGTGARSLTACSPPRKGDAAKSRRPFQELRKCWCSATRRDDAAVGTRIIEATELALNAGHRCALAAQSALLELNQLRGQSWTNNVTLQPVKLSFGAPRPGNAARFGADQQLRVADAARGVGQQGFKVSLARKDGYRRFPSDRITRRTRGRPPTTGRHRSFNSLPLWNRNKEC